jgi:hypothetical protein
LKKVAVVQKTNISHGKIMMDIMVRRRELPCVRRLRGLYSGRVVRGVVSMSMQKKKSDEEANKKQRNGLTQKRSFVARSGV